MQTGVTKRRVTEKSESHADKDQNRRNRYNGTEEVRDSTG